VDKRIKCCLAEDVWWEPLEEVWMFLLVYEYSQLLVSWFLVQESATSWYEYSNFIFWL
jgi:hypothetical protein